MPTSRQFHTKEPLYRKVNTTAHNASHRSMGDFRDDRRSKAFAQSEATRLSMHGKSRRGLDYKPLFQFLLSKVGQPWVAVHAEAVSRLDQEEPIFWLVAQHEEDREDVVQVSESSYFSGLYVDEAGVLQKVNPAVGSQTLKPRCACCTHTFNGKPFSQKC